MFLKNYFLESFIVIVGAYIGIQIFCCYIFNIYIVKYLLGIQHC